MILEFTGNKNKDYEIYGKQEKNCKTVIAYNIKKQKQIEELQGTLIFSGSYDKLNLPNNSIIYCDPPYEGVFGYKDKFNHSEFWQWCRDKTEQGHKVYISEYNAPKDFKLLHSVELPTNMNAKHKTKPTEKLFTYE